MVLATLGYAPAAGADMLTAMELANTAAGLEVERLGVVPLTRGEILAELGRGPTSHKKDSADGQDRSPLEARSPNRAADRDDQRLLRSAASRPRRFAASRPPVRRLPAGRLEQRPQCSRG